MPDSSAIFQRMKKGLCTNAYFSLMRQPLLNFLEIAVFTRFSVGRTAEYLGRTSAIFEKYRLYRIENLNYIQQFFHLLSKQLSSGNSSIFVIASAEEIFDE